MSSQALPIAPDSGAVLTCAALSDGALARLLARYGLELTTIPPGQPIPGSFWGDSEAGVIGLTVWVRPDTPVHSALHEACHVICMDEARRRKLHTDAGGDYAEEDAVCYLQILLAGCLPEVGRDRLMADMDAWGYTFRLGSAIRWFAEDAEDALAWLRREGIVDNAGRPTWRMRG